MDYAASEASGLLIDGDLFEFGIAYRSVVPRKHVRVLAKLADVVEAGLAVYVVAGNHDHLEWGGHVLEEDLGITLLRDPVVLEIAGRRALITHRVTWAQARTVRGSSSVWRAAAPVVAFLRSLHPDWAARLQPYTTTTRVQVQRHGAGHGGGPTSRAPAVEAWARSTLQHDSSLDLVIAGHAHLPVWVEVERGRFYLNAGDWITHDTYWTIPVGGAPEIRQGMEVPKPVSVATS